MSIYSLWFNLQHGPCLGLLRLKYFVVASGPFHTLLSGARYIMPARHSKNAGDRAYYSHAEKKSYGLSSGTQSQRLGTDSQLAFGSCPLTLNAIVEAVVSPSGRIYEREAILEYLLKRTKELKDQQRQYEDQQVGCHYTIYSFVSTIVITFIFF